MFRRHSETLLPAHALREPNRAGAPLAFGTDWTVAPLNPMESLKAAVARQTLDGKHSIGWISEQKITLEEAIRAYTVGSAHAEFQEQVQGSLTPGKLADVVMLDRDIFAVNPSDLDKVKAVLTIVDGKAVCESKPSSLTRRPAWPNGRQRPTCSPGGRTAGPTYFDRKKAV
jgi:hypothetical protein